jgi:hypothetical protein
MGKKKKKLVQKKKGLGFDSKMNNKDYNSEDDEEVKTADEYFSKSDAVDSEGE